MLGFAQLLDAVPDALLVVDAAGRIRMANRQASALFGYPHDDLPGRQVEDLIPAEARERHHAHRETYMASPRIRPMGASGMALAGRRSSGEDFPVEIALSPLATEEGTVFLASIRDISESQRSRQALVRAGYDALIARFGQEALASRDESHLVERVPGLLAEALGLEAVAIVFLDEHGAAEVRASAGLEPRALEGTELRRIEAALRAGEVMVADGAGWKGCLPGGPGPAAAAILLPLLAQERAMGALLAWSRDSRGFGHDAMHLLQSTATLLASMVQRRRIQDQLSHAQRLDAIGQLTGGVAHDFNNLLTVLSGCLQLLELRCGRQPDEAELIRSALASIARGAELTSKLLAFARRQRLSPRPIAPARQLHDLEVMLRRTLGPGVALQVDCPADLDAAYADAAQLDAALLNLALNARDAMPRGGTITIAAREGTVEPGSGQAGLSNGRYIVFSVSDTGKGMDADALRRAIEPFYTTKGPGRGSGLGLSMVYGFVTQSGGDVTISSREGEGTRVEVWLPRSEQPAGVAGSSPVDTGNGSGQVVVVVEDDGEVRRVAAAFVESLGYRARPVASADEALRVVDDDPDVALVFSDVMLGNGPDGLELGLALQERHPEVAVLLTTGFEDTQRVGRDTAFEVLRKPYHREQLGEALRRALRGVAQGR